MKTRAEIYGDVYKRQVYNDTQVQGSEVGPVAYFRNGTGNPLVSYTELSCRWGLSRATVCRILKKLDGLGYISIMSFPGRHGSVIYLQNYLSTMFEISEDVYKRQDLAQRHRKVTFCARVTVASGEKVVALVPTVMPCSTAHSTAL